MNKKKVLKKIVPILMSLFMLTLASCSADSRTDGTGEKSVMADYKKTVQDSDYILHALGGMDETDDYINSIECLEAGYEKGCRLFEADVSFTSDKVLVLAHSGEDNIWSENDWKLRLCQVYPFDKESEEELKAKGYDVEKHLCTYDEFMSFRIQGWYKTASFSDLLDYMEQHDDIYVMVDGGHRSYEDTLEFYKAIKETAGDRTDVLNRLIAGGQTSDMVKAAREVYDFPLINLYFDSDEKREDALKDPEDFIKYCHENDISSFSAAKETIDEKNESILKDDSLISYIFTVNDEAEEDALRKAGADIIGTDFLWNK